MGSRIVWITGASSGIGAALAETFALHGDHVVASGRNRRKLEAVVRAIARKGVVAEACVCDVSNVRAVRSAATSILRQHELDILINNAGITAFKEFARTSVAEFDRIIDTNLRGLFLTTQAILPPMLKRRRGMIINILSFAARATYTKSSAYAAAKAGAAALMDGLRAEVRHSGIRIVNVYPGAVLTPMWPTKLRERYASQMMDPMDVARLVFEVSTLPASMVVEELVVRPKGGDLRV